MRDRIPRKPTIVVQNMPGAGSLKAAKFLNEVAPRDGQHVGVHWPRRSSGSIVGTFNASFDVHKLNWLGSASKAVLLGVSWHTSSVKTLADAVRTELIVGSPTATSEGTRMALLYNAVLGTEFKVVTGLSGNPARTGNGTWQDQPDRLVSAMTACSQPIETGSQARRSTSCCRAAFKRTRDFRMFSLRSMLRKLRRTGN